MFVRDFMTRDPLTITPEMSHPEALALLRKHHIRRLPVISEGKLVGIVAERDLLSNEPSPATTLSVYEIYFLLSRLLVRDIMVRPVVAVEGDCPIEEAARIMVSKKISCLPVLEGDKVVGIITETDIFRTLVEVLGGQETGYRVVVGNMPERIGEIARLTGDIAGAGGNIVAITSSSTLAVETIKVAELGPETLRDLIEKRGLQVVDLRPFALYEPKLCG